MAPKVLHSQDMSVHFTSVNSECSSEQALWVGCAGTTVCLVTADSSPSSLSPCCESFVSAAWGDIIMSQMQVLKLWGST